jgi:HlyD family secretion protein
MSAQQLTDLSDCTEFAQTLRARPPGAAHGTAILLVLLLGSALLWAGLTEADLVVTAGGRVRPLTPPQQVFLPVRGESLSASAGGRVVEVNYAEGREVRPGDVLIRLDAGRIDTEIARRERLLHAGEEELARLFRLRDATALLCWTARARAAAELTQAEGEAQQARERQAADVRLARTELGLAEDEARRLERLGSARAAAESEIVRARARVADAQAKLARAGLAPDEGRVLVCQEALVLAERDEAARREELALKCEQKRGEIEAARLELSGLERERGHAVLRAPVGGVVTTPPVKVGDVIEAGRPVVEIAEPRGFRFEARVTSADVGELTVGMRVRLKLDAYDYQRYGTLEGIVEFIAPDSGGTEGGAPPTYIVRVAPDSDEVSRGEFRGRLKLGMTGQAEMVTGRESVLALLVKKVRKSVRLG